MIGHYIDEAFPGRPLFPQSPRERARARLVQLALADLHPAGPPGTPMPAEALGRVNEAWSRLDAELADGGPWLGGADPSLVDFEIWPMVWALAERGHLPPNGLVHASRWWERVLARDSFRAAKP